MTLVCKLPPLDGLGLSQVSCHVVDRVVLVLAAIFLVLWILRHPKETLKALACPVVACHRVYRHFRRKHLKHEFFEVHKYSVKQEGISSGAGTAGKLIYPTAVWETVTVGAVKVPKAVLRVTFPHGVRRRTIEDDLDLWSGAWRRWFYAFEADERDPRVIRLHAATVPAAVDLSSMPDDLPAFSAFLGVSERLSPLTRHLVNDACAGLYSPSGSGKTAWSVMYLASIAKTTPYVRMVVISTKNLAVFRRIPGTQVLNAFREADMTELRQLLRELNRSADELLQLLDAHGVEHLEDLYRLGVVTPESHPRWVLVCDEAKDYLRPLRRPTVERPFTPLEEAYSELIDHVGAWFRKARCLSRHCLIALQDPLVGALAPAIELDTLSWRVVGRLREAVARSLVQSDRPAREAVPRGVFFLHENNELVKFRGPYDADFLKGSEHSGERDGKKSES